MLDLDYSSVVFAFLFTFVLCETLFDGARLVSESTWVKNSYLKKWLLTLVHKLHALTSSLNSSFLLLDDAKRFLCATYESIGSGVTPWLTSFNNTAAVLHSLLWCRVTNTSFWKTLHVAFRHEGIVQEGLVLQDYTIDVLHQGILIYLESIYIHLQDCIQQIKRMSFNRFYSYVILSLIFCSSIFSLSILWSSILFSMTVMLLIPCAQLFDILYHFFTKLILN